MRVKIIPHGVLRKTWPLGYECEADTPAQAINALVRVHKLPRGLHQVRLVGCQSVPSLYCPMRSNELHVVPDFSGGGGFFKIAIGAVLVAVAIVAQQYELLPAIVTSGIFGIGLSLALGGVLELLTPSPKANTPVGASNYLGAPGNTVAANTPIPIGFGRFVVYGQFLSFNIQADITDPGSADTRRAALGFV